MPIQSTPVTTQSSINLSDINIDTDLNMGANSIVGYALSSSIPQVKFIDITTSKLLQPDGNNDYIEKLNDSTEYTNTTKNDTIQISLGTWESLGFEVGDYALIRWETKLTGYMNSAAYLKSGSSALISQLVSGGYTSFKLYKLFCITSISDSLTINTKSSNEAYAMKTKDNIVNIFRFKDITSD